jgi:hypothetical protein
MRKFVAVVVMLLTGLLQPVTPLLAATLQVEALPACCRAHGRHHCMMAAGMMTAMMAAAEKKTAFRAPRCPYSQGLQILPSAVAIADSPSSLTVPLHVILHLMALPPSTPGLKASLRRNPRAPPAV